MSRPVSMVRTRSTQPHKQLAWCVGFVVALWCLLQSTWVFAAGATFSKDVETRLEVSSDHVQVAEPFSVTIRAIASQGTAITFPKVNETWGDFNVLDHRDQFDIPAADGSDRRIWSRQLTLETINTGNLELPAVELQIQTNTNRDTLRTEPRIVRVISVLENQADPLQFRDIRDVVDVAVPQPVSFGWLWWIAGGTLGLGFAMIAVAAVAKRKTKMTPRQWAEHQLEELCQSSSYHDGDSKSCLERIERTLRRFLEWEFSFPAQNQTANELLAVLNEIINDPDHDGWKRLSAFLSVSERVKFAGRCGDQIELNQWLNDARMIVASLDSSQLAAVANETSPESEEA